MKRNTKQLICRVSVVAFGIAWMIGCRGVGGGSGSSAGESDDSPPPVVASVRLGLPISSIDGEGGVNGALFSENLGEVIITMDPDNPSGFMSIWMQVNVFGATISHYDWEIVGWKNQDSYGEISYYDEVIDIDPAQGGYKVRSFGNKVRYDSTSSFLLSSNHNELVKVTAWSVDGHFTTAYFNLFLVPISGSYDHAETAASSSLVGINGVYVPGQINPETDIDMFRFYATQGKSYTIRTEGLLDTQLTLYGENASDVLDVDDDGGAGWSSLIYWVCPASGTYYIQVNSYNGQITGSYTLGITEASNDSGKEMIELFILAGQSNMEGHPEGWGELPASLQTNQENALYWSYVMGHGLNVANTDVFPVSSTRWGPETVIANELRRTRHKVAIVKTAYGGTGLDDWLGTGDKFPYTQLTNKIITAISDLERMGYTVKVNSLTWMQGETDTITQELGTNYYDNFLTLIDNIKADCNIDELEVNLCRISGTASYVISRPYYSNVSNAQTALATFNSWIHLVSTDGLTVKDDNVHFDANGVIGLSLRILDCIKSNDSDVVYVALGDSNTLGFTDTVEYWDLIGDWFPNFTVYEEGFSGKNASNFWDHFEMSVSNHYDAAKDNWLSIFTGINDSYQLPSPSMSNSCNYIEMIATKAQAMGFNIIVIPYYNWGGDYTHIHNPEQHRILKEMSERHGWIVCDFAGKVDDPSTGDMNDIYWRNPPPDPVDRHMNNAAHLVLAESLAEVFPYQTNNLLTVGSP